MWSCPIGASASSIPWPPCVRRSVERAEYYRRRLEWITRTLTWWRLSLLGSALVFVVLAATVGPPGCSVRSRGPSSRCCSSSQGLAKPVITARIDELRDRVETIEREGVAVRGRLAPLPELGSEVGGSAPSRGSFRRTRIGPAATGSTGSANRRS